MPDYTHLLPGALATVFRIAHPERGLSYLVCVDAKWIHCPAGQALAPIPYHSKLARGRRPFVPFSNATVSAAVQALPPGPARVDAWIAHKARAWRFAYQLAVRVYPELNALNQLPDDWITGLLPIDTPDERVVLIAQG